MKLKAEIGSLNYPIADSVLAGKDSLKDFVRQGGLLLKSAGKYQGYRGPLQATAVSRLEITDLQKLLNTVGKEPFDCSYRVAFEFGALTALRDEAFHNAFFAWKHEVSTALLIQHNDGKAEQRQTNHLTQKNLKLDVNKPLPSVVLEKIEGWKRLKGIPYSYLVPSAKMLPLESIRHFCIDRNWINAFLIGVLSIGNTYRSVADELSKRYQSNNLFLDTNRYGFLVHSIAVSGWPDYEVDVLRKSEVAIERLERKKIAPNMELFLYEGDANDGGNLVKLTFHLPKGKTHSGFGYEDGAFVKQLYQPTGEKANTIKVEFHDRTNRTIKMNSLVSDAKGKATSAYVGMLLLQGVPKVEFNLEY
ncbi:hypothetical protein [Chryseobacterium sediminis]|uniref:hypothetical protein n=1 Tax=Chryseobacterium sediminis TaxID=1679494 RepID=UPI00285768E3|nr:hypothetical protein [Chryseobacterium sediminis]MDR6464566.1 hypothetical protein [Chryseobacterium sediminis]